MLQRLVVSPNQIHNQHICLTAEQEHYLCRVLRLQTGDHFIVMDGQGTSWLAQLMRTDSLTTEADILEEMTTQTELPVTVTLVAALPKGNGFDEVVRQSTELGVSWITPVISDRTLLKPSPQKLERWQRIAAEAAEQSERQYIPEITAPIALASHLQQLIQPQQISNSSTKKFLCVTRKDAPHLLEVLQSLPPVTCTPYSHSTSTISPITIAIGPEGGWTDGEIEQAIVAGYQPVTLGARILRTVTAPLVALSIIAAVYERG